MGGYDSKGPHLCEVSASGFCTYVPFVSMGSGSTYALSILEKEFREDLTLQEATELAIKAIKGGIIYDNASGSNVDFVQITKDGTNYKRNYEVVGQRMTERTIDYNKTKKTIERLSETVHNLNNNKETENPNRIETE